MPLQGSKVRDMTAEVFEDAERRMQKAVEALRQDARGAPPGDSAVGPEDVDGYRESHTEV